MGPRVARLPLKAPVRRLRGFKGKSCWWVELSELPHDLDRSGAVDLGVDLRDGGGAELLNIPDNIVGGTEAGAGNIISELFGDNLTINEPGATGNVIQGNFIGTDVTGTVALGSGSNARMNRAIFKRSGMPRRWV